MRLVSKPAAMALGMIAALSAATFAQNPASTAPAARGSAGEPLVIGGIVEWIEKSDVSALNEGVIDQIELREGMEVPRGGTIGTLHAEKAHLGVAKAQVAFENVGAKQKAEAQKLFAQAELARLIRLEEKGRGFVSKAEKEKAAAEVKIAEAAIVEAGENHKLAEAELNLAKQIEEDHTIKAPFDGIIIKRLKHPGETVRANEAVVRLGKIDRLRFYGFLPIEALGRIRPGMVVDIRPNVDDADLPLEQKRFRGKITAIGTEVNNIGKTEVEVFADVNNNNLKELRPGLKADMTIYIDSPAPPPPADMLAPPAQVGSR